MDLVLACSAARDFGTARGRGPRARDAADADGRGWWREAAADDDDDDDDDEEEDADVDDTAAAEAGVGPLEDGFCMAGTAARAAMVSDAALMRAGFECRTVCENSSA